MLKKETTIMTVLDRSFHIDGKILSSQTSSFSKEVNRSSLKRIPVWNVDGTMCGLVKLCYEPISSRGKTHLILDHVVPKRFELSVFSRFGDFKGILVVDALSDRAEIPGDPFQFQDYSVVGGELALRTSPPPTGYL